MNDSLSSIAFRKFFRDRSALAGLTGAAFLLLPALYAPLLANGRPIVLCLDGKVTFPFFRFLFAPDSTEFLIEQLFNYLALLLPLWGLFHFLPKFRNTARAVCAALLLIPFFMTATKVDKTDYRVFVKEKNAAAVFAPVPYGPFELAATPCAPPDKHHWFGTDDVGRDVLSRMIYGARSSLAVGIIATALSMLIGAAVGLAAGFYRNWVDLTVMRIVEVLLCFPSFLLLLILMSISGDRQFEQSILVVIAVLALTGWIGLTYLVRGEVLKQRDLPYIQSCEVLGLPPHVIMFRHLLPNITGPILISFTFGVAGAILAESSLSFLGFGVQPPTASWGGLLRQAFDNPLDNWHLTLFPGLALFIAIISFNFIGEGLRHALDMKYEI